MKRILYTIMLMFIVIDLFAINPSISIGIQERYTNGHEHSPYYITINLEQEIGKLILYGEYTNEFIYSQSYMFAPTQDYFTVGASVGLNFATVKLEHMCMHPVLSRFGVDGIQGGYTRFEVTIGDK